MSSHERTDDGAGRSARLLYLVAPAGVPNYGDELIASAWLDHLAEVEPDAQVWVDTHSPGPAAALLSGHHPNVRFTDTLWRLSEEAPSDNAWQIASWVQQAVRDPGMAPRLHHGIELLGRADVLHIVGGGFVNDIWAHHMGLLAGVVAAAKRSGARTAMTGQGLVPTAAETKPLLRALADRFDIVDVRDAGSAELLGVPAGIDDTFLGLGSGWYADGEVPEVMLCLQSDLVDGGPAQLAAGVLSTLRSWKVDPEKVGVVEGIPRTDRHVYELLEHELPGARFYPFAEIWEHGLPVGPDQTWISSRFHPHLVAAAAGANGVAISVRPDYYAIKHGSLTELGSGWTLVTDIPAMSSGSAPERPVGGGFDAELVARLRASKRELAGSIYARSASGSADAANTANAAAERGAATATPRPETAGKLPGKLGRLFGL